MLDDLEDDHRCRDLIYFIHICLKTLYRVYAIHKLTSTPSSQTSLKGPEYDR